MRWSDCVCVYVCVQGLQPSVQARVPYWHLQVDHIDLVMDRIMSLETQTIALPKVLNHLSTMPHPPPIRLRQPNWHWPRALLCKLGEAPASTPNINATVYIKKPLTDERLSLVLQARGLIASVSVLSLSVQSDLYANTADSIRELICRVVPLSQMVKIHAKTVPAKKVIIPADVTQVS